MRELAAKGRAALLCVERDADACHRSIIAQRLAAEYGMPVLHLVPKPEEARATGPRM